MPGENNFLNEELDVKPNKAAAKSSLITIFVLFLNWVITEIGIFRIDVRQMRIGSIVACFFLLIPLVIKMNDDWIRKPQSKYINLFCVMCAILCINVFMSFHVTLALILPSLLAMQYYSEKLGWFTFIGSLLVNLLAPIISFLWGCWDTLFLQVMLQLCSIDAFGETVEFFTKLESVGQIVLYLVIPRTLIICVTAVVMFSVIRRNKLSVDDRIALEENNGRVIHIQNSVLGGMAGLLENRNGETGVHVINTRKYVELIVNYLMENNMYPETISKEYAENLISTSILHDVGKISISDTILNKPGKLTPEEYDTMKTHTTVGDRMIDDVFGDSLDENMLNVLHDVVYCHHETWDGKGYPRGLRKTEIPLAGRIMAVADVFDALVSDRVYKKGYSIEESYNILIADAGAHFDPDLIDAFVAIRPQVEAYLKAQREKPQD